MVHQLLGTKRARDVGQRERRIMTSNEIRKKEGGRGNRQQMTV